MVLILTLTNNQLDVFVTTVIPSFALSVVPSRNNVRARVCRYEYYCPEDTPKKKMMNDDSSFRLCRHSRPKVVSDRAKKTIRTELLLRNPIVKTLGGCIFSICSLSNALYCSILTR
mmetsp:Transcript_106119/g.297047  ORF Transcript_106119/g.297047 Transcript_106119/m.297047 type:complete len:116 (+) Transcript_106119:154-501(+)